MEATISNSRLLCTNLVTIDPVQQAILDNWASDREPLSISSWFGETNWVTYRKIYGDRGFYRLVHSHIYTSPNCQFVGMQNNKNMTSRGATEAARFTEEPKSIDETANHPHDLSCNQSEDLGVSVFPAEGVISKGTNLAASARFILPEAPCQSTMPDFTLKNGSANIIHGTSQMAGSQPKPRPYPRRGSTLPGPNWGGADYEQTYSSGCKRTLVLCFDGTGNKFKGNSGDTNILKIFSMLDRRKGDQYHYYQRESVLYESISENII